MLPSTDWRRHIKAGDRIRFPYEHRLTRVGTVYSIEYLDDTYAMVEFTNREVFELRLVDIEEPGE